MKKIILILTFIVMSMLSVRAEESLQYLVNVDYGSAIIGTAEHSSGEVFQTINIPGLDYLAIENDPSIPVKYVKFEVPVYVNDFKVSITSSTFNRTLTLSRPIIPFEALTTNEVIEGVSKEVVYGQGYSVSGNSPTARVSDEHFVNGYRHFVVVEVRPMVYHHNTLKIDCYSSIGIKLEYSDCTASELKFRPIKSGKFQDVHPIDEMSIAARSSRLASKTTKSLPKDTLTDHYVFITPASLKNSLQRLVNWKRQKGYKVTVKTVEDILSDSKYKIGSNPSCFDKESSVREWMKEFLLSNGTFYCLIVGDFQTSAPIRKFQYPDSVDRKRPLDWTDPYIDEYIPTDVYFADLVTDWNLKRCDAGMFVGNVTTDKFSPTLPVGRLLCWNDQQVRNFTDKVILYEMYPGKGNSSYLSKGFVVKHQDFFGSSWEYPTLFSYTDKFDVQILRSNASEIFESLKPYAEEVIAGMKKAGLYSLQGHGGTSKITFAKRNVPDSMYPKYRSIRALEEYVRQDTESRWEKGAGLDMLKNPNCPAVAYSWACSIAPYDGRYELPGWVYNMASAFTVAGNFGGPAFLANTRQGWFGISNVLEDNFAKHIEDNLSIGILENNSKKDYKSWGSLAGFVKYTHNIIGDSEIKIWTECPVELTGTVSLQSGKFVFNGSPARYSYGVMRKNAGARIGLKNSENSFSINPFEGASNNKITAVYVESDKYLPQTFLVTTGNAIDTDAGSFVFRDVKFSKASSSSSKSCDVKDYSSYLNLGKNGKIGIFAFNSIYSDSGIIIGNGGAIELECENNVTLKGDTVSKGGHMTVKGKTVTFEKGFSIAAGGTLSVNL